MANPLPQGKKHTPPRMRRLIGVGLTLMFTLGVAVSGGIFVADNWCFLHPYQDVLPPNIQVLGNVVGMQTLDSTLALRLSDGKQIVQEVGIGYMPSSSFFASDGTRLFYPTPTGFVSLDAATGKVLWQADLPPYFSITAQAVDGTSLIIVYHITNTYEQTIASWRLSDGQILWSHNVNQTTSLSIILAGPTIIALSGNDLAAFNPADGTQVWQIAEPPELTIATNASTIFLQGHTDLVAIQALTGKILWQVLESTAQFEFAPVVTTDVVYSLDSSDVVARWIADGAVRWRKTVPFSLLSALRLDLADIGDAVVVTGQSGYDDQSRLTVSFITLDRATGQQIVSATALGDGITIQPLPAQKSTVWIASEASFPDAGTVTAYDAHTAKRLFTHDVPKNRWFSTVITMVPASNGTMLIGYGYKVSQCPDNDRQGIEAFNVTTGQVIWMRNVTLTS